MVCRFSAQEKCLFWSARLVHVLRAIGSSAEKDFGKFSAWLQMGLWYG